MSKKNKKPQKLRARLPRGFVDRSAADIRATNAMMAKIADVYERYGFDPVETPQFEYTDCLGKFLPDSDRPNEGVFSLTDDDDQWMSLRYDLTAPLARHVAENINDITLPYRTYRNGWVFRNEKPGPGRFRQFMQFDADTVGAPGVQADAEMCMMMADVMEALGIKRGDYVIRVNNRKVLDGVMELAAIEDYKRLDVLRTLDKVDRLGRIEVRKLLQTGREDESGDLQKGLGLSDDQVQWLDLVVVGLPRSYPNDVDTENFGDSLLATLERVTELGSASEKFIDRKLRDFYIYEEEENTYYRKDNLIVIEDIERAVKIRCGKKGLELPNTLKSGLEELRKIANHCNNALYATNRIEIAPSVVRGLEYYTGPVYEAELLFPVKNEKGQEVVFGSVGGGGRYDGLIKRFTGQDVPATGFSIGVSRLMTALKNNGLLEDDAVSAPVLVTVMDGDAMGDYQKMVQDLRNAGIRAEMYQGNWKKFPNQLRYADKRGCPIAIIQGSDEREAGKVQLKDMMEGKREAAAIESNEEYRAARPGQKEVDAADLVAEVKAMLEAQKAD